MIHHSKLTLLLLIVIPLAAHSQNVISVAAEFLEISQSPEANAQGGTSVSRITDDPYAVNSNPAHLGFSSGQTNVTYSFFPTKTEWLSLDGLTFNSYVYSGGINLEKYCSLPLSVGVAYSRVKLDYGNISLTTERSSDVAEILHPEEHADAYSLGAGLDVGVQVSLGITFRRIESSLATTAGGAHMFNAAIWSRDYGLLFNVPVIDLFAKNVELIPAIAPLCDLSFGSALTNVGDKLTYIDRAQQSALPRTLSIGTTIDLGIKYSPTNHKLLTFTWSRESRSLLVGYIDTVGNTNYRGLFGDINFFKNIVGGKQTTLIYQGTSYALTDLAQGWQVGIGEILYIRGGSFHGTGDLSYTTKGIGFRASGIFKLLDDFMIPESGLVGLIQRHFDIRYDWSYYSGSALDNTKFSSLTVTVKL